MSSRFVSTLLCRLLSGPRGLLCHAGSVLGAGLLCLAAGTSAVAAEGAARVDAYLAGLSSLTADFEQYTFNAERTRMTEASGRLYLQRPGRFRWEYDRPTKQVIIADGKRVYLHDLELEQVSHQSQSEALSGTPALLLADDAPIEKHFRVRAIDSTDGRDWVELIPKDDDTDVVRIELGFGETTLDSIIMADSFGQETRLNFTRPQRNPSLDAQIFKIDPRAVEDFLEFN